MCIRARYIYIPKVLVIVRKRWLRPDMTETLFSGTLSKNETKTSSQKILPAVLCYISFFPVLWDNKIYNPFESRVRLNPRLGGMTDFASVNGSHEQTQYK